MRRQSNSALLCMYGGWKRHYREKVESCVQCVFKNVQERRRKKPHWSTAAYENARADERWRELVAGGMKGHCWLVSGTMWGVGAAVWRGGDTGTGGAHCLVLVVQHPRAYEPAISTRAHFSVVWHCTALNIWARSCTASGHFKHHSQYTSVVSRS